jgi:hypothetical protein
MYCLPCIVLVKVTKKHHLIDLTFETLPLCNIMLTFLISSAAWPMRATIGLNVKGPRYHFSLLHSLP